MKNSAFAALSISDGSQYVFCQDVNGSLRQEYFPNVTPLPDRGPIVFIPGTENARNNTPLSAFSAVDENLVC